MPPLSYDRKRQRPARPVERARPVQTSVDRAELLGTLESLRPRITLRDVTGPLAIAERGDHNATDGVLAPAPYGRGRGKGCGVLRAASCADAGAFAPGITTGS